MAVTSGSFLTNSVSYVYNGVTITTRFRLDWQVTNTDLVNNQYTINVKLTQLVSPDGYQRSVQRYSITIDGATTSNTYGTEEYGGNGTIWANYNQVITMNDNGQKTVSFSVSVAVGQWSYNCTASQSFTMGTIPRYSTLTIPTMTMGEQATITVNQAVSSFYSVMGITYNGTYTEFPAQTGSSFTVQFTPADITASVTDSDHADALIQCFTYFDSALSQGNLLTEETAPVYVPANIVPSTSITSIVEANPNLSGLPFVVGYSLLRVTFTFTGNTGSTLKATQLTCGSETVNGTTLVLTTTIPLSATSNAVTVKVIDSRGREATATQTVSAVLYSPPTLTLDLTRTDTQGDASPLGTNLSVKATWNYANISGNSATIATTASGSTQTYTPTTNPQTSWTEIAFFTNVSAVDELTVSATITDAISSSNVTITLPKAVIPISMYDDANDVGVTFGRTAVEKDVHFFLPVHLYDSQTIVEHESTDKTHNATDVMFWDDETQVTQNVVTRSSGDCQLTSSSARRFGKVVTIHMAVTGISTSRSAGTNVFSGTVPQEWRPNGVVSSSTFYGTTGVWLLAVLEASGAITVKIMVRGTTNTTFNFSFTFVQ